MFFARLGAALEWTFERSLLTAGGRAYKQKIVTGAIILVLILVIAIILYEKLS